MQSNLSLFDVTNQFARFSLPLPELYRRTNRASLRLLNSDVFTDLYSVIKATTNAAGFISIPRAYGRAFGANQCGVPLPVLSQWQPFLTVGFGRFDPTSVALCDLQDIGNTYCTQTDVFVNQVRQPGTLRWTPANGADAGTVARFFGTDANSATIFDPVDHNLGLNVTAGIDTTQVFLTVDGIQFPTTTAGAATMIGGSTLSKVIATVATQIGAYEYGETRPQYQHYYGGAGISGTPSTWWLYCKRQYVNYVAPGDWVYPGNLDALEHAFDAMTYKDRGDAAKEAEQWQLAEKVLKQEYASTVPYPDMYLASDSGRLMYQKFPRGWWNGSW